MPPSPTPEQLGAAIRRLREKRELSIEGLAATAEIHWTYLSGIERGTRNPSWDSVTKIASALETTVGELERVALEQEPGRH